MTELVKRAARFAGLAHEGQKRKYTGEPYLTHCAEVVEIVKSVPHTEAMLAAAWLHDVVEDCGVTLAEVESEFGTEVAVLVEHLTDVSKPEDGSRRVRKTLDREHSAKSSPDAKTIKLADLISNTHSIVERDPKFARVYLVEKLELLEVLKEGDASLWTRAHELACAGAAEVAK